jgi:hypothetical protein
MIKLRLYIKLKTIYIYRFLVGLLPFSSLARGTGNAILAQILAIHILGVGTESISR